MEHIVQFAIGIDDEAIRQRIKETGYEQVIRNLVDRAETSIADRQWNRDGKVNWERLVESAVKRFVEENKEAIINLAAEKMCEKYSRTKVYKEHYRLYGR